MEKVELLMDSIIATKEKTMAIEAKQIEGFTAHNNLVGAFNHLQDSHCMLIKKHNGLCKASICICIAGMLLAWQNVCLSKAIDELKKEEKQEG